jgi:galactokinase
VVAEIARVQQSCFCLVQADAAGFGRLMAAGHASLRDLFEVSLPELDGLVEAALSIEGCYGARLTGAGFGGCTVNLVARHAAGDFMAELERRYRQDFGRQALIYCCQPSRGAHLLGT